jgi:hypothetical protein
MTAESRLLTSGVRDVNRKATVDVHVTVDLKG